MFKRYKIIQINIYIKHVSMKTTKKAMNDHCSIKLIIFYRFFSLSQNQRFKVREIIKVEDFDQYQGQY